MPYFASLEELARVRVRRALPLPGFDRDRQGRILTTLNNVLGAVRDPSVVGCMLGFDEHRLELLISEHPGRWRAFTDADAIGLRMRLEAFGFKGPVGKSRMRDVLTVIAATQRVDSSGGQFGEVTPALGEDELSKRRRRASARRR